MAPLADCRQSSVKMMPGSSHSISMLSDPADADSVLLGMSNHDAGNQLLQSLSDLFADEDSGLDIFGSSHNNLSNTSSDHGGLNAKQKAFRVAYEKWSGSCQSFNDHGDSLVSFGTSASELYSSFNDLVNKNSFTQRGQAGDKAKALKAAATLKEEMDRMAKMRKRMAGGGSSDYKPKFLRVPRFGKAGSSTRLLATQRLSERMLLNENSLRSVTSGTSFYSHAPPTSPIKDKREDFAKSISDLTMSPMEYAAGTTTKNTVNKCDEVLLQGSAQQNCQSPKRPVRASVQRVACGNPFDNHHDQEKNTKAPAKPPKRKKSMEDLCIVCLDSFSSGETDDEHEEAIVVSPCSPKKKKELVERDACPLESGDFLRAPFSRFDNSDSAKDEMRSPPSRSSSFSRQPSAGEEEVSLRSRAASQDMASSAGLPEKPSRNHRTIKRSPSKKLNGYSPSMSSQNTRQGSQRQVMSSCHNAANSEGRAPRMKKAVSDRNFYGSSSGGLSCRSIGKDTAPVSPRRSTQKPRGGLASCSSFVATATVDTRKSYVPSSSSRFPSRQGNATSVCTAPSSNHIGKVGTNKHEISLPSVRRVSRTVSERNFSGSFSGFSSRSIGKDTAPVSPRRAARKSFEGSASCRNFGSFAGMDTRKASISSCSGLGSPHRGNKPISASASFNHLGKSDTNIREIALPSFADYFGKDSCSSNMKQPATISPNKKGGIREIHLPAMPALPSETKSPIKRLDSSLPSHCPSMNSNGSSKDTAPISPRQRAMPTKKTASCRELMFRTEPCKDVPPTSPKKRQNMAFANEVTTRLPSRSLSTRSLSTHGHNKNTPNFSPHRRYVSPDKQQASGLGIGGMANIDEQCASKDQAPISPRRLSPTTPSWRDGAYGGSCRQMNFKAADRDIAPMSPRRVPNNITLMSALNANSPRRTKPECSLKKMNSEYNFSRCEI